mmetsp:Transcript_3834/g.8867  ORF Transcript_3834/g.8867 Transcript_3834/m.8867 type:complete len:264 (+) Transcript_3834:1075-1866(+)
MRSATATLSALEVTIGGRCASLLGFELVVVHSQTHRASGFAPVESGLDQDLVESLVLGLLLHETRSWNDVCMDSFGDLAAHGNGGYLADIFDTTVGTGTNECLVDLNALEGLVALETDVVQGSLHGRLAGIVAGLFGIRDEAVDGCNVLRRGSPGDRGSNVFGLDLNDLVVNGILVGTEALPVFASLFPIVIGRRHGASLQVCKSCLVRCDESGSGTGLDRHVGDTHSSLHGQRPDGASGEFNNGSCTTGGSDDTANVEDDIL